MLKSIIFAFVLIASATCFDISAVQQFVNDDHCVADAMENLKPKITATLAKIQEDEKNYLAQAELLKLIDEAKVVFDSCNVAEKAEPVLGDAVKAAGISFLLASNCFKDVGVVLLLLDSAITDPSIPNDIAVLIFGYILGKQGYADCSQFIHFIL